MAAYLLYVMIDLPAKYAPASEGVKRRPKTVVFLAVEGECTEKDYFDGLMEYMQEKNADYSYIIEVLRPLKKGDTGPRALLEILLRCQRIVSEGLLFEETREILKTHYQLADIKALLDNSSGCPKEEREKFNAALFTLDIDLKYRRSLIQLGSNKNLDVFAVVCDRDCQNHPSWLLDRIEHVCVENGFGFYLSNPCFELWLLFHFEDVLHSRTAAERASLLRNKRKSNGTPAERLLARVAGHHKSISRKKFKDDYSGRINTAINNALQFSQDTHHLMTGLGSNIPDLMKFLDVPMELSGAL